MGDVDGTIQTLIIRISNIQDGTAERLAFFRPDGLNTSYVASNGFLRFTAGASTTNADFQQVLNSITYQNTLPTPNLTTREITFVVNDGELDSSVATTFVSFGGDSGAPVNEAPTTSSVTLTPIVEDSGTITITQADLLANSADADGDPLTATGLINSSGNGSLVDNGDGTWNYTPAADDDSDVSFSYTVTDNTDDVAGDATLDITPVNDAPVLAIGTNPQFDSIFEDDIGNAGESVGSLLAKLGDPITDVDGDPEGIAVTNNNGNGGTWQYSTDDGANWFDVGPVSTANALLLRDTDLLRLNPDGQQGTNANLGFRAWDRTIGDEGTFVDVTPTGTDSPFSSQALSAQITVTDVNDAPVLDNAGQNTLTAIDENNFTSAGDTVANIIASAGTPDAITDVDADAVEGIAIYAVNSPEGTFEYSTDGTNFTSFGVPSTSAALTLGADAVIRFVPNPDFTGNASFTYRAWDQTEGTEGGTIDLEGNFGGSGSLSVRFDTAIITVNNVDSPHQIDLNGAAAGENNTVTYTENDSPILVAPNAIVEDFGENDIVSLTISGDGFGGPDTELRIEGQSFVPGEDISHMFDVNGQTLIASNVGAGDSIIVTSSEGTDTPILTSNVQAIIQGLTFRSESDGINTDDQIDIRFTATDLAGQTSPLVTSTISLIGVNDSPELDDTEAADFTSIDEDDFNSDGTVIATILDRSVSDQDGDPEGIAIFNADQTNGIFQYQLENTTEWVDVGDVSDSSALLLDASTRIRFVPAPDYNGDATISFRAWDQTIGAEGEKIATAGNFGGTNSLSTGRDTAIITVNSVNDAPAGRDHIISLPEDGAVVLTGSVFRFSDTDSDGFQSVIITMAPTVGTLELRGVAVTDGQEITTAELWNEDLQYVAAPNVSGEGVDSFTFQVRDDGGTVNGGVDTDTTAKTINVNVIAINQAPTIDLDADDSAGSNGIDFDTMFVGGGNAVLVTDGTALDDVDGTIQTVTVSITDIRDGVDEVLSFTSNDNISSSYTPATGVLTLINTGTATNADFEQVLNSLTYENTSATFDFTDRRRITFVANDGELDSSIATTTVTFELDTDSPEEVNNSRSFVDEGGTVVITNDNLFYRDVQGPESTTYTVLRDPANGFLALSSAPDTKIDSFTQEDIDLGNLIYVHDTSETRGDEFTFVVIDARGNQNLGDFRIIVNPVNDAPTLTLSGVSVDEGSTNNTLTNEMLTGTDVDDAPADLTYRLISTPSEGLLGFNNGGISVVLGLFDTFTQADVDSGKIFYTHSGSEVPTDSFDLEFYDGGEDGAATRSGTFEISVNQVNDAPTAVNDDFTVTEDGTLAPTLGVDDLLQNDSDPDGDTLTVNTTPFQAPANGTLLLNSNGTFSYRPNADFSGTDSFVYEISDAAGTTSQATVEITVEARNDSPVLTNTFLTSLTVVEDSGSTSLGLASVTYSPGGGTDEASQSLSYNVTNVPDAIGTVFLADGVTVVTAGSSYTLAEIQGMQFETAPDANGTGLFTFEVVDDGGTAFAGEVDTLIQQIAIEVTPVNDDPVAVDDAGFVTQEDTPITIAFSDLLSNDSDADGDTLQINAFVGETNGTVQSNGDETYTFTPDANFSGVASFDYIVNDGNNGTDRGTVEIIVGAANDDPLAVNDEFTTVEDTSVTILPSDLLANDSDPDGDTPQFVAVDANSTTNGTLQVNGDGSFAYTPNENFFGTDSFTYGISDGNGGTAQATVNINVTSSNDAPTISPITLTPILEDSGTFTIIQDDLLVGANDVDGNTLSAIGLTITSGTGTLTDNLDGTWDFTPDVNDDSVVSFSYDVTDGNATVANTATLDITPVNDDPVAVDDLGFVTQEDTPITIALSDLLSNDSDIDGDTLDIRSVGSNTGSVTFNADDTITFTPDANFNGVVTLTYFVNDGNGGRSEASIEITVEPVNDDPSTAIVTLAPIAEDSGTLTITQADLLANSTDIDGDALSATGLAITSGNGTLVDNGDGTWDFTPDANDDSGVSFSYDVTDGNATVANTASLDITPVNDDPVAADDSFATSEDNSLTISTSDLLANDSDVDGDTLTVSLTPTSGPTNGTLSVNSVGSFSYTPDADFNGTDTFTYQISDGNGGIAEATVEITVNPVNDTPTISPVTLTPILEDSVSTTITQNDLLVGANDVDGDTLFVDEVTITSGGGTLTENGDGTWSFTPAPNDNSGVTLGYNVTDGTDTVANIATLDITPVNDDPIAVGESFSVDEDGTFSATLGLNDLLQNDSDIDGDRLLVNTVPVTGPANGTLTLNSDGTFTYAPNANFSGSDSFTYEVIDGNGGTAQATVNLTINSENDSPSIRLTNLVNSLEENIDTANSIRVANIVITDDNIGVNDLSLSGADASNFEIVGDELRVVAGATLDHETVSTFDVIVEVDDPSIGSTAEDSVSFTLNVTDVNESPTITLVNVVQAFDVATNFDSGIKVADIVISDDALGIPTLQLTGPDADLFEIIGDELFFKPNGNIDSNRLTQSVSIQVDDAEIGQTFDDSVNFTIETDQLGIGVPSVIETSLDPEIEVEAEEDVTDDMMEMTEEESESTQLEQIVANPIQNNPLQNNQTNDSVAAQTIENQVAAATADRTEVTDLIIQEASDQTTTFAFAKYGELVQRVVGDSNLAIPAINQFAVSNSPLTVKQFGEMFESATESVLSVDRVVVGSSAIATTSLSVGYVVWMLRGGSLFASFVTSLPAWTSFDLLPVLDKFDEESLADIADS